MRLSITYYRIGCRKRTLIFSSFISGFVACIGSVSARVRRLETLATQATGFAALDFTYFGRIPIFTTGRKVEIVSFVIRFYGII